MTLLERSLVLLMREHGAPAPAIYKTPTGDVFEWQVMIGMEKGGESYESNGDTLKAIRLSIIGPRSTLAAHGVTRIQRNAIVTVNGEDWSIDLTESRWGDPAVVVGLIRKLITRHQEMESHGSV